MKTKRTILIRGSWFWRLRPDEAVVFLGTTPPEMTYFGFTGYLYDRYSDGVPDPPDCTAEGKPDRTAPRILLESDSPFRQSW